MQILNNKVAPKSLFLELDLAQISAIHKVDSRLNIMNERKSDFIT